MSGSESVMMLSAKVSTAAFFVNDYFSASCHARKEAKNVLIYESLHRVPAFPFTISSDQGATEFSVAHCPLSSERAIRCKALLALMVRDRHKSRSPEPLIAERVQIELPSESLRGIATQHVSDSVSISGHDYPLRVPAFPCYREPLESSTVRLRALAGSPGPVFPHR